jgi:CDP-glucose 4,6-dehydratase
MENMAVGGMVNSEFWKGKKVFITGHTGFKGTWLSIWLNSMGAILAGYALAPNTKPNFFEAASVADEIESIIGDVRDLGKLSQAMGSFAPDIVIHMAAQPLVRLSYKNPVDTYSTNVMGTVHLLEAVRSTPSVKAVVNVTTDKCYENKEWIWGYREDEPMGGRDPYSNSKGCSELVTAAYRSSFFNCLGSAKIGSGRAGNVIGGGDWAEDRLIPDFFKSFKNNEPVIIRNPSATRPWQHVLEPLSGYLVLAEQLYLHGDRYAEAWNFGPEENDVKSVRSIIEYLVERWGDGASWIHDESEQPHEAQLLKLDISKAKKLLGWQPKWDLFEALDSIIEWQKVWLSGRDIKAVTLKQIRQFEHS